MFNLEKLRRDHARTLVAHRHEVKEATKEAGAAAAKNVRERSTFKRRGAHSLKDSTQSRVVIRRGGALIRLSWPKKYAAAIDKGARAHEIWARRAPYLRFFWPRVGHVVHFKMVHHPGNRPFHFGKHAQKAGHVELGQRLRFGTRRVSSVFRRL